MVTSGPFQPFDCWGFLYNVWKVISFDNSRISCWGFKLFNMFNSLCTSVLDTIASFRPKQYKDRYEPWLNKNTRHLRQVCRRAEQRWKKDKLQLSYEIMRESLSVYQTAVKTARSKYFSMQITKHSSCSRALFNIELWRILQITSIFLNIFFGVKTLLIFCW